MDYLVVLPPSMLDTLRTHLLTDRGREQFAVVLCGRHQREEGWRLLGRRLILPRAEQFSYQSSSGLVLAQDLQAEILRLAAREGLSQIDFHTHPGEADAINFSTIDDEHERALAGYLARRLPETCYGSVVLNSQSQRGRLWSVNGDASGSVPLVVPPLVHPPMTVAARTEPVDPRYDRQVRAFGTPFQQAARAVRVGLVGCGGLGSILVEQLTRLGIRHWTLIDPDAVDVTSLNRLLGSTPQDADEEYAKVDIAARTIRAINPESDVNSLRCTVSAPRALSALTNCDLIIVATDNHASRLIVNALAAQYLIPLVHVGVNLAANADGGLEDISGEVVIPEWGAWCLACAGIVSSEQAGWELARPHERAQLAARGYLADTPAPAVMHLNGTIASLGVSQVHNLIAPYKPLKRWLVFRDLDSELMTIDVPPHPGCLHCGSDGRLGLGDLVPVWRPTPAGAPAVPAAGQRESEQSSWQR
jgi:molybdopterin-synthase adenylyltransferase